jgi:nicotinamidase-related amidase
VGPSSLDSLRVGLLLVDVQNTFCVPGFELFVGGRSGMGAVEDTRRLCAFIYRNLGRITEVRPTLDTHTAIQIFHALFFVNDEGEHPAPYTLVTAEDLATGRWRFNAAVAPGLGVEAERMGRYLAHYTRALEEGERYALTIWPYHAMLGGIGHALVSAVEEAVFFHSVARAIPPAFHVKGDHPLTESYSALGPEVVTNEDGTPLAAHESDLMDRIVGYDALIIAGQAKSHCVAWTVNDLLSRIEELGSPAADRVYLLEDCMSPVVVPGVIDYTEDADRAFRRFGEAGMHVVRSTEPMDQWPGPLGEE